MMTWVTVVYQQGDEADETLHMLYDVDGVVWSGPYEESIARTVAHLAQWDNGEESEHTPYTEPPWGPGDRTVEHDGYTLAWDLHLGYVSLNREVVTR